MAVPALITPSRRLIVGPRGMRKPARPVLDVTDPINRGLVACYPIGFIPASNTANWGPVQDISQFANNATCNFSNAVVTPPSHHGGTAYSASDLNHYISAPNKPWLGLNNFTICGWGNPLAGAGGTIVAKRNSTFNYALRSSGTGKWQCYANIGGTQIVTGSSSFPANNYSFACGTYDGANLKVWFNGVVDGTLSVSGTPSLDTTAVLGIGAWTGGNEPMLGYVDGIRVYNRPLSASEIARLYAEPYAGIYEAGPRWRVGAAAAGGTTRPVKMVGRWGGYAGASGGFAG